MKETWKTIYQLVNERSKTTNISSLKEDNKILTSSDEIAESMNRRKPTFAWRSFLEQKFKQVSV